MNRDEIFQSFICFQICFVLDFRFFSSLVMYKSIGDFRSSEFVCLFSAASFRYFYHWSISSLDEVGRIEVKQWILIVIQTLQP